MPCSILVSWALLSTVPRTGEIVSASAFYDDVDRRRIALVGLYLMPFAVIAFIWFEVALRMWISGTHRRANVLLSNVQLVSGIVFVTLFAASTATTGVTAAAAEWAGAPVDPATAAILPAYGDTLLFVFAIRHGGHVHVHDHLASHGAPTCCHAGSWSWGMSWERCSS